MSFMTTPTNSEIQTHQLRFVASGFALIQNDESGEAEVKVCKLSLTDITLMANRYISSLGDDLSLDPDTDYNLHTGFHNIDKSAMMDNACHFWLLSVKCSDDRCCF